MDTLNENQIKYAKECVYNIQDKISAVATELHTRDNPHKRYLKEKLDIINTEVQCLLRMVNSIDD